MLSYVLPYTAYAVFAGCLLAVYWLNAATAHLSARLLPPARGLFLFSYGGGSVKNRRRKRLLHMANKAFIGLLEKAFGLRLTSATGCWNRAGLIRGQIFRPGSQRPV